MSDGDDGQRDEEMETLEAIFLPEQLTISTAAPYYFTIQLNLDAPPIDSDCGASGDTGGEGGGGLGGDCSADDGVACTLTISLPLGYPVALPLEVTVDCPMITGKRGSELISALHDAIPVDGEPKVWEMCEWLRGNAHLYFTAPRLQQPRSVLRAVAEPEPVRGGFMREWCSFVSLYEQSYCKGDTRFVVMTKLAQTRGLNITGMGIAGKPGGLVAEGEESDVVEFMRLMRTEFFETLNPRGRKLTTRLQDRWPLDVENERYDVAEITLRRHTDVYKAADRAAGKVKKKNEADRLALWESKDAAVVADWERKTARSMGLDEAQRLIEVGKPLQCDVVGVYDRCGPTESPPSREHIEKQRLFSDFTIFQGVRPTPYLDVRAGGRPQSLLSDCSPSVLSSNRMTTSRMSSGTSCCDSIYAPTNYLHGRAKQWHTPVEPGLIVNPGPIYRGVWRAGKEADLGNITGKQVKTYGDGCKEAGNLFRELGREDGFDAMFTFRFS